jgi:predicted transcriptional regulator
MDRIIEKTIGDTVCRIHKTADFTLLSNGFIRSTRISCQSITLLASVMGLPTKWNYTVKGLEKIMDVGETAVRNMLDELKTWGYLTITKISPNKENGGRFKYIYDFYEYSELDDSVPKLDVVMVTFTADNATLYKVQKDCHFTAVSNKLLRSKKLNPKQKGLLLKVMTLPNTWRFSVSGIVAICKEGVSAVKARISELIKIGFLVRTQLRSNETKSRHFEYIYEFFEFALNKDDAEKKSEKTRKKAKKAAKEAKPKKSKKSKKKAAFDAQKQDSGFQSMESPQAELPQAEKQAQYKKDKSKKKNKKLFDKSSISSAQESKSFNGSAVENSDERLNDEARKAEIEEYTEIVKENIDYWELGDWLCQDGRDGYAEADEIVGFIVDEICSDLPYTVIKKQKIYRETMRSAMLKANIHMVENALLNMAKVDGIHEFQRYFITTLYNETLSYHFNEGCECRWAANAVARDFGYAV